MYTRAYIYGVYVYICSIYSYNKIASVYTHIFTWIYNIYVSGTWTLTVNQGYFRKMSLATVRFPIDFRLGTRHYIIRTSVGACTTLRQSCQGVKPISHQFLLYCAITMHWYLFLDQYLYSLNIHDSNKTLNVRSRHIAIAQYNKNWWLMGLWSDDINIFQN